MADSIYWTLITAAHKKVAEITGLQGVAVALRKGPVLAALRDAAEQVIVSPDPDLAERLVELQFGGIGFVDYDVYVVQVFPGGDYDPERLRRRLNRREEIRNAMLRTNLLGATVAGQFDWQQYDPAPGIDLSWLPANLDATAQKFVYRVAQEYTGQTP